LIVVIIIVFASLPVSLWHRLRSNRKVIIYSHGARLFP